ncbi:hypothetical protein CUMW_211730, partial [Citrus unshiu]
FVKESMPRHLFTQFNDNDKTPKEVLAGTRKDLVQEGMEWLTKTFESCSVVAALIATVVFATSATELGGVDQESAACLPMTLFARAQLPLYFDLIWAIFKKVPQHSYKVISD